MSFQQSVSLNQAFGVVGEIFLDGPVRAQPGVINSDGASPAFNRIGRAFTQVADADGFCTVGGTIGEGTPFYGILANPKSYASFGTVGNTIGASLDLHQYSEGEFVTMGQMIVSLPGAASIGDLIDYTVATGVLTSRTPVQPASGAQRIAFASNVATVTLTPADAPAIGVGSILNTADGQSVRVVSLGTGTGGNGTYNVVGAADHAAQAFSYTSVPASGNAQVPNAEVIRYNLSGAGLAVIALTN